MSPLGAVAWLLAVMWARSATSAVRRSEARLRRVQDMQRRAQVDAQHALAKRIRALEGEDPGVFWPQIVPCRCAPDAEDVTS